jgi:hypothetical protein
LDFAITGFQMTCTQKQIELLLKYATTYTKEVAAAKAGMSLGTAKRYLTTNGKKPFRLPTDRNWRTRRDPFEGVWADLKAMLERDQGLEAQTLMDWLLASYPDQFNPGQVRTLRRRVHDWRVLEGPERKEVMFAQTIMAARQSQSDYTHCSELEILIDNQPFPHLLYHFMLPYSRWEFVWICHTESFETLTKGYELAVAKLGAVAPEHRTDNLAAAVPVGEHGTFQVRWMEFLKHYSVIPSSNNPGCSNENGSVEKSNDLFKHAIDQRLRLRGDRNFRTVEDYETYLEQATLERNRLRQSRLEEELALLIPLPKTEWYEPKQYSTTVTAWSTVSMSGVTYSVPSRYIGQKLRGLVFKDQVRIYYGRHLVMECRKPEQSKRCINYRHLILHLMRKPGAFRNYQYREELFPRVVFRQAYDALLAYDDERADKEYLRILNQAALDGEESVAKALGTLLESRVLPASERVYELCRSKAVVPAVEVFVPKLQNYDALLNHSDRQELRYESAYETNRT